MSSDQRLDLAVNNVLYVTTNGVDAPWYGGRGTLIVESSAWGGGSVALQYLSPNGTWIGVDASLANFTANGMVDFELPPGKIRVLITTATAVYAYVLGTRIV